MTPVATCAHNRAEARRWAGFWAGEDVPTDACPSLRLSATQADPPDALSDGRLIACLVDDTLDELAHSTTLGAAGFHAALRLWLDAERGSRHWRRSSASCWAAASPCTWRAITATSRRWESASHPKAWWWKLAAPAPASMPTAAWPPGPGCLRRDQLWGSDGLLPEGVWALMPTGRAAFAQAG